VLGDLRTLWLRWARRDEGLRTARARTLVYVEAETRMRTYEDAEGRKRTQFNLVQRTCHVVLFELYFTNRFGG